MLRAAALASLALLGVVVAGGAAAAGPLPAPSRPTAKGPLLQVVARAPVIVWGLGFRARERVTVTVATARGARTEVVRAGTGGRFLARFVGLRLDACAAVRATARGSAGSRARTSGGLPECRSASTPLR